MARSTAISLSVGLLCAGAGCATQMTVVRPLPPEKEAEINRIVAGADQRQAEITVEGEPESRVSKDVHVAARGVSFRQGHRLGTPHAEWLPETEVPIASVRQIEVRTRGRAFWQGFGIGAGIGAVLGGIGGAAFAASGNLCESSSCNSPSEFMAAVVVGGALVAGLLGAGIGAAIGAPTTIEFKDAPR